ncbi:hypothetical protein FQR65_LT18504 [Abscondita terminalis]|nr:hypothetical protein FQR65_LT18504 [Abscondita terminalis]
MQSERKRTPNFTGNEEAQLLLLIKKYQKIIETKKSDTATNADKISACKSIEGEFNAVCGESFRDWKVLKKKYENLKKRTKKKFADQKCELKKTGGGPPVIIKIDNVDEEIKEILGSRVEGLPSEFGGDITGALAFEICNESALSPVIEFIDEQQVVNEASAGNVDPEIITSSQEDAKDWGKYTPAMVRQPKSPSLAVKRRKTHKSDEAIVNHVSQWTAMKVSLEESRKEFLKEEQELKLRCYKEKHDEELRLMRSKAELQETLLKEKHKIEVEILNIQKQHLLKSKKL